MGLWRTHGSPNLGQNTRPYNSQQKKIICKIADFAVLTDHWIKLKECEKKDKYLNLARELKKLWNMKVTIIAIVTGAFGTVTKLLLKGLEDLKVGGQVETIIFNGNRRIFVAEKQMSKHDKKILLLLERIT